MIDAGLALSLLGKFAEGWKLQVAIIHPQGDLVNEPAYRQAVASGAQLRWVTEKNVRRLSRAGWVPFHAYNALRQPSVFVDKNRDAMLMIEEGR